LHINYTCVQYPDVRLRMRDGAKIRGFFAKTYSSEDRMHNHTDTGPIYRYPVVQYKVIEGIPTLVGVADGANLILDMGICTEEINIENTRFCLERAEINTNSASFGTCNDIHKYIFKTPWLALNQNNSEKYRNADELAKDSLLSKILIGNLLSMAKSLDCWVNDEIRIKLNVIPIKVNFKGKSMIAFKGGFKANFDIPDYLGVGKSVSRGYGSIEKQ